MREVPRLIPDDVQGGEGLGWWKKQKFLKEKMPKRSHAKERQRKKSRTMKCCIRH